MANDIQNSYDGTAIFKPARPLSDVIQEVEARRANTTDPIALHHAKPEVYKKIYKETAQRLSKPDVLTVNQAAKRLRISPAEYLTLAEKGEAILISIEEKLYVPVCSFAKDGGIDALKVDVAREFSMEGQSYFKFLDYLRFMTADTVNIVSTIPNKKLSAAFRAAGVNQYQCSLTVNATMNQLIDGIPDHATFRDLFMQHLDSALIQGGWDPMGGLSRPFRDKYNIPGQTIHEQRMAPCPR